MAAHVGDAEAQALDGLLDVAELRGAARRERQFQRFCGEVYAVKFMRASDTPSMRASAVSILPTQLAQSMPSTRMDTLGGVLGAPREAEAGAWSCPLQAP